MKQAHEKLREEFLKLCKEDLVGGIHYQEDNQEGFEKDMNEIADWWLSKISSLTEERVRWNPIEIAEKIVIEYANISGRESENRAYVRRAAETVLSLLQTNREDEV